MPDEAKEIMRDFILNKHLDEYLFKIINPKTLELKKFAIDEYSDTLFGNLQTFKETLEQQNEEKWKYLKEFKEFLKIYGETNYSQYVDFKFKVIPIEHKINKNN